MPYRSGRPFTHPSTQAYRAQPTLSRERAYSGADSLYGATFSYTANSLSAMEDIVQMIFAYARQRTRKQVEESFDQLHARGRELHSMFEKGMETPQLLAELIGVRYKADAEYELLRLMRC